MVGGGKAIGVAIAGAVPIEFLAELDDAAIVGVYDFFVGVEFRGSVIH